MFCLAHFDVLLLYGTYLYEFALTYQVIAAIGYSYILLSKGEGGFFHLLWNCGLGHRFFLITRL